MGRANPDPRVWAAVEAAEREGRILRDTTVNADALPGGLVTRIPPPAALPAKITETKFQDAVRDLFVGNGWDFYHTRNSKRSDPGFPDCVAARFVSPYHSGPRVRGVAAELKVGKRKPTDAQRRWLELFRELGFGTYLWYPADWPEIVRVATAAG